MPLGHRIRLLKAISNFEASEKSAVAVAPAPEPWPTARATGPPIPEAVGERRHVTVMFCDVGAWLRDLGLGQYEAAFRENEIDSDAKPCRSSAGDS
jgi:SAM domain (Sterile alpha motif)